MSRTNLIFLLQSVPRIPATMSAKRDKSNISEYDSEDSESSGDELEFSDWEPTPEDVAEQLWRSPVRVERKKTTVDDRFGLRKSMDPPTNLLSRKMTGEREDEANGGIAAVDKRRRCTGECAVTCFGWTIDESKQEALKQALEKDHATESPLFVQELLQGQVCVCGCKCGDHNPDTEARPAIRTSEQLKQERLGEKEKARETIKKEQETCERARLEQVLDRKESERQANFVRTEKEQQEAARRERLTPTAQRKWKEAMKKRKKRKVFGKNRFQQNRLAELHARLGRGASRSTIEGEMKQERIPLKLLDGWKSATLGKGNAIVGESPAQRLAASRVIRAGRVVRRSLKKAADREALETRGTCSAPAKLFPARVQLRIDSGEVAVQRRHQSAVALPAVDEEDDSLFSDEELDPEELEEERLERSRLCAKVRAKTMQLEQIAEAEEEKRRRANGKKIRKLIQQAEEARAEMAALRRDIQENGKFSTVRAGQKRTKPKKKVIPESAPRRSTPSQPWLMCRSASGAGGCPHGRRCRFAHTGDELVPRSCGFASSCKCVKPGPDGSLTNVGPKLCTYIHDHQEDKEAYLRRIGVSTSRRQSRRREVAVKTLRGRPTKPLANSAKRASGNAWEKSLVSEGRSRPAPSRTPSPSSAKPKTGKPICRSVQKGIRCKHAHCRFLHPEPEARVSDEKLTSQHALFATSRKSPSRVPKSPGESELVLKVPSRLAVKALLEALEAGHKKIKFVFSD